MDRWHKSRLGTDLVQVESLSKLSMEQVVGGVPVVTVGVATAIKLLLPPSTDLVLDQRFAALGGETVSVPNMIGD